MCLCNVYSSLLLIAVHKILILLITVQSSLVFAKESRVPNHLLVRFCLRHLDFLWLCSQQSSPKKSYSIVFLCISLRLDCLVLLSFLSDTQISCWSNKKMLFKINTRKREKYWKRVNYWLVKSNNGKFVISPWWKCWSFKSFWRKNNSRSEETQEPSQLETLKRWIKTSPVKGFPCSSHLFSSSMRGWANMMTLMFTHMKVGNDLSLFQK